MKISLPLNAKAIEYTLDFENPAGTSRGVLTRKPGWFILLSHSENPDYKGIGECSLIPGLSPDHPGQLKALLPGLCQHIEQQGQVDLSELSAFPALVFALEMALKDLETGGQRILYPSAFTRAEDHIPINGLIWMDPVAPMKKSIQEKIEGGFTCIKLKIGALHFEEELKLLRDIRARFPREKLGIRLDANGAFKPTQALEKLKALSDHDIHSIEQPIPAGQWEEMAALCDGSPIPIALDEELIGLYDLSQREKLLRTVKPAYVILKPSLLGGFASCERWIDLADQEGIGWWITSALESNIGLNAIAQWTYLLQNPLHQGLGTGGLYTNNFPSPLYISSGTLRHDPNLAWNLSPLSP